MMTDQQLRMYADALLQVVRYADNPVDYVFKRNNPVLSLSYTIVVSKTEPVNQVLPLNVIWLVMDDSNENYKMFFQRTSKTPNDGFEYTWIPVTSMTQLNQVQYFDASDSAVTSSVGLATETDLGLAKLTVESAYIGKPKFVAETDPRLSDARYPTEHTSMHSEIPATRLKHSEGEIAIIDGPADEHDLIVAADATSATLSALTVSALKG
jgi:hypothetical protein